MIFKKKNKQYALFVIYVIRQGKFEDFNVDTFYNYREALDFVKELQESFGDFIEVIQLFKGERIKQW